VGRLFSLMVALVSAACGSRTADETMTVLDEAVARVVDKEDDVHHAVLHVDAPDLGVSGTWVHGEAAPGSGPMTADTPFLSASVGKLFTAMTVVGLDRDGALSLGDPVSRWVRAELLEGLPGRTDRITVGELLSHRSGLPDYFDGATRDGTPTVFEQWVAEPGRAWTREAMLDHARRHQSTIGAPGERFEYSDTNYTLLGFVIEGATGAPSFQEVVAERIIEPLGLTSTRYHHPLVGEPLEPDWAEAWADDVPLAHAACLSGDQAGGGLVTTTGDLARLLRSLATGEGLSFDDLEGGAHHTRGALGWGIDYGYGRWTIRPGGVFPTLGGMPELYGASGSTGSFAYYVPEYDAVIAGTVDQTSWREDHVRFLLSKVMPALARTEGASE